MIDEILCTVSSDATRTVLRQDGAVVEVMIDTSVVLEIRTVIQVHVVIEVGAVVQINRVIEIRIVIDAGLAFRIVLAAKANQLESRQDDARHQQYGKGQVVPAKRNEVMSLSMTVLPKPARPDRSHSLI
jgi:hypothetical protein